MQHKAQPDVAAERPDVRVLLDHRSLDELGDFGNPVFQSLRPDEPKHRKTENRQGSSDFLGHEFLVPVEHQVQAKESKQIEGT